MQATSSYEKLPKAERFIGSGKFGWVQKVRRREDGKILACKSIQYGNPETASKATVERECAILTQLQHPNIIKQHDIEWQPHKAKIYMEYCEGGSLQDLIDENVKNQVHVSEHYIWNVCFQLAAALLYCHLGLQADDEGKVSSDRRNTMQWNPVLHRDIKPANVFLSNRSETANDAVRLGDFGLGYVLQESAAPDTYAGTAPYLAPEINRMSHQAIHWTEHCDMFSLGCTLYALCSLGPPFRYHMESNSDVYDPLPDRYSDQLRACIAACLSFQPQIRPNALRLYYLAEQHSFSEKKRAAPISDPISVLPSSVSNLTFPNRTLFSAIYGRDADLARMALGLEGVDPNTTQDDSNRAPVLCLAAKDENSDFVTMLLKSGANVNQTDLDQSTPLHYAVKASRVVNVRALSGYMIDFNKTDLHGRTALSYAAEIGNLDIVQLLLEFHAAPDIQDTSYQRTSLHWAAQNGHSGVAEMLMKAGSDNSVWDRNGHTPEGVARRNGHTSVAVYISRSLKKSGADRSQQEEASAKSTDRADRIKSEKAALNKMLKKFSEKFKLMTPVPKDLVPILAQSESKQKQIVEKAQRDYEASLDSGIVFFRPSKHELAPVKGQNTKKLVAEKAQRDYQASSDSGGDSSRPSLPDLAPAKGKNTQQPTRSWAQVAGSRGKPLIRQAQT